MQDKTTTNETHKEMGHIMKTQLRSLPMAAFAYLFQSAGKLKARVARRLAGDAGSAERGDVPGWVMITLMSAFLVAGLLALAAPALEGLFNSAISKVK